MTKLPPSPWPNNCQVCAAAWEEIPGSQDSKSLEIVGVAHKLFHTRQINGLKSLRPVADTLARQLGEAPSEKHDLLARKVMLALVEVSHGS